MVLLLLCWLIVFVFEIVVKLLVINHNYCSLLEVRSMVWSLNMEMLAFSQWLYMPAFLYLISSVKVSSTFTSVRNFYSCLFTCFSPYASLFGHYLKVKYFLWSASLHFHKNFHWLSLSFPCITHTGKTK